MSRHRTIASLLLVTLLIGGCSIGFVYRQLDWLIPWHLEDYIELDSEQSDLLSRRLNEQLQWHCATQLDSYAQWLRSLRGNEQAFQYSSLQRHAERVDAFIDALAEQLVPDIARILATADDTQIDGMMENLEEHNRELREEFIDVELEDAVERRRERMVDILEQWLGDLNEAQTQAVADWAQQMGAVDSGWLENRKRWQQQLYAALQQRERDDEFRAEIKRLFVHPESVWSEQYQRGFEQRRESVLRLLAAIDGQLTSSQRQHLNSQINDYAESFERLSCNRDAK